MIVNGPTAELGIHPEHYNEVRGYIMNINTKQVVSKFGPNDMQFKNPHDVAVTEDGNEIYVAELNPTRIHKFLHKTVAKSVPMSAAKPTATSAVGPEYELSAASLQANGKSSAVTAGVAAATNGTGGETAENSANDDVYKAHMPGGTAILVVTLMLLFAFLTFAMALLIARRRKRGNAALSVGEPSQLVYRKLVASSQNVCDESP